MAKEFLGQRGIAVQEKDVTQDPVAAAELARLGQRGVPVIVADGDVIVGFDRPRLDALARRRARPALGLRIKDAPAGGRPGVLVGGARAGSPAERAGLRQGDIITGIDGQPLRSATEFERRLAERGGAERIVLTVARPDGDQTVTVRLR
jgi:S1-C subfamily serine protease